MQDAYNPPQQAYTRFPDGISKGGFRLFLNIRVPLGHKETFYIKTGDEVYAVTGQARWIAGLELDGALMQEEFSKEGRVVARKFSYTSLESCFGPRIEGYRYAAGFEFSQDLPIEVIKAIESLNG